MRAVGASPDQVMIMKLRISVKGSLHPFCRIGWSASGLLVPMLFVTTVMLLSMMSQASGQANALTILQVSGVSNNLLIEEVEYEVARPITEGGPCTWIQTAPGQDWPAPSLNGNPLPADVPVLIRRVQGPGGLQFFPEPKFPTTTNFHPRVASGDFPAAAWATASEINCRFETGARGSEADVEK